MLLFEIFQTTMKVHPIIDESLEFLIGEHVCIYDTDDDMHGKEGIFLGRHLGNTPRTRCYLILLIENQKYIQVSETKLRKMTNINT